MRYLPHILFLRLFYNTLNKQTLKKTNSKSLKDENLEPHTINKQIIRQNIWNKLNFMKKK